MGVINSKIPYSPIAIKDKKGRPIYYSNVNLFSKQFKDIQAYLDIFPSVYKQNNKQISAIF